MTRLSSCVRSDNYVFHDMIYEMYFSSEVTVGFYLFHLLINLFIGVWKWIFVLFVFASLAVHPDKIRIATGQIAGVDKDGRVNQAVFLTFQCHNASFVLQVSSVTCQL